MKKIFLHLLLFLCGIVNAQNLIIKETLFSQPETQINNGYFKNGFNVVLKNQLLSAQGQVIEITNSCDSVRLLDSFYYTYKVGFIFYEKNSNLFYERVIEDKTNNDIYLLRKNLTTNTLDSVFIQKNNRFGIYLSKIKRFGDTSVVQIWRTDSISPTLKNNVNDFYILVNKSVIAKISKPKFEFWSAPFADYYLLNRKLFIACNYDVYKLALYVHDLITNSVDSTVYNVYKPINNITSSNLEFYYTKINGKLYLLNGYQTYNESFTNALVLLDIGNGTNLAKVKEFPAYGNFALLTNASQQDYFKTGFSPNLIINRIETDLGTKKILEYSRSFTNSPLQHSFYFENGDTQFVCGDVTTGLIRSASIVKIYRAKTGIEKNSREKNNIVLSPNPAKDYFNFNASNTPEEITATDILGHQVQLIKTMYGYDISLLADGMYFVDLVIDNKKYVTKVWVKK